MYSIELGNPWVQAVKRGGGRIPAWAIALAAAGIGAAVVFGGRWAGSALAGALLGAAAGLGPPLPGVIAALAFNLVVFGTLALIALLGCALGGRAAWRGGASPWWAPGGALVGLVGLGIGVALVALAGAVTTGVAQLRGGAAAEAVLAGVALFGVQVAAEELYFRGWLQPVLCARWGGWTGLAATAVLFAGLHLAGGARAPLTLLNLFLGGLLFGLLALRSGGLWAPIMAHFAWNWTEACGLGLEQSPGIGPSGSIVHLALTGPPLWSGGDDRLDGSLAMTVALAALVVGFAAFGGASSAQSDTPRGRVSRERGTGKAS